MSRSTYQKKNSIGVETGNLNVILIPVPEDSAAFEKRKREVQNLIAKMILMGRKRGRPSLQEDSYEEAA